MTTPYVTGKMIPGFLLCLILAALAWAAQTYGPGPMMLWALVIGMFCHPLLSRGGLKDGVDFSAGKLLKIGVALLGVRITTDQILSLGPMTVLITVLTLLVTLFGGWALARRFGLSNNHAILSAGAVAICGSSAALAIAAALPKDKKLDGQILITVIGVTTLSTIAMVAYPFISTALGMGDKDAGLFFGATIHNVAQVVGAGYVVSEVAGDTSAIVKMLRVSCLLPVVIGVTLLTREKASAGEITKRPPLFPPFLIGFVVLVALNSFGLIPETVQALVSQLATVFLVTAVAAIGVKTSLGGLKQVGATPLIVMVLQTLLMAAVALSLIFWV